MRGAQAIPDEDWTVLLDVQAELISFFNRVSRLPREAVEDCVSEGVLDVATEYDPVEISTEANHAYIDRNTVIAGRVRLAAQKRIDKERRRVGKMISDDTPIGEEDGDMRLRDLFIPRHNTAERIENYAEWKMFARRGGCPLTSDEIDIMFGL